MFFRIAQDHVAVTLDKLLQTLCRTWDGPRRKLDGGFGKLCALAGGGSRPAWVLLVTLAHMLLQATALFAGRVNAHRLMTASPGLSEHLFALLILLLAFVCAAVFACRDPISDFLKNRPGWLWPLGLLLGLAWGAPSRIASLRESLLWSGLADVGSVGLLPLLGLHVLIHRERWARILGGWWLLARGEELFFPQRASSRKAASRLCLERVAVFVAICLSTLLYLRGAIQYADNVNTRYEAADQGAYMNYAKAMRKSDYAVFGGRSRMPVYPFLLSRLWRPGLSDSEFFVRGKLFGISASLVLLVALYFVFRRLLTWPHALLLIFVAGFTVFMFRAAYVKVEWLYYFLSFFCFVLLLKLFSRPEPLLGALTGVMLAVTYLSKMSIAPAVALFIPFFVTHQVLRTLAEGKIGWRAALGEAFWGTLLRRLLALATLAVTFGLVVYPYASNSKRVFGSYFYNVNSRYYMWCDSWEEVKVRTRAYGDRTSLPQIPEHLLPGPAKYLREHSLAQITGRLTGGLAHLHARMSNAQGYYVFVQLFAGLCMLTILLRWRLLRQAYRRYLALIGYVLSYFIVSILLCAWWTVIHPSDRFVVALFLPMLFCMASVGFLAVGLGIPEEERVKHTRVVVLFYAVVTPVLLYQMQKNLLDRILHSWAG